MALAFLILLLLIALLWLWLLVSPAHRATFTDCLDSCTESPRAPLPPVCVILAARNEAAMLPRTIPTICRQEYPQLPVIVVDDQSDDDTPRVLEQLKRENPNLITIRATDRPEGWIGKCWAIQQGVECARNLRSEISDLRPLLLFTDADILYHPRAVHHAVAHLLAHNLDMLSLMPRCICETPIERLGVGGLISLLTQLFPTGWANDPNKKWSALACGAFMLVRPDAYARIGGHACVKRELIEDMNLAKHLKQSGARVAIRNTRDLIATRMYETFADLWEGLTKNAYAGMEYQPRRFWVGLLVAILVSVLPPIYLALAIAWAMHSRTSPAFAACGLAFLINLFMILIHARCVRHLKLPFFYAFTLPLSATLYSMIVIDSVLQHHFRGGNVWKGRRYDREMLLGGATTEIQSAALAHKRLQEDG
jgi:hopene-associated glycosyltransferase HpnB